MYASPSLPQRWKWKSLSRVRLCNPVDYTVPGIFQPQYWSGQPSPSPGDLPNPGIKPRSPALQAESLPAEPPGKTKNTGMGSLSLRQGIFPNQESNRGLLHWRQILYQPSWKLQCSVTSRKPTLTQARYKASHHSVSPHAVTVRTPHLDALHKATPTPFLPPLPNPWQLRFCSLFP